MPSLWITSRDTEAKLQSERVIITPISNGSDLKSQRNLPLIDIDLVVISSQVRISTPLLNILLERHIPIFFLDGIGRQRGQFLPALPAHAKSRLIQYQVATSPAHQAHIATTLIAAKIYNQRRTLQRLALNRNETDLVHISLQRCTKAISRLENQTNTPDQIMGVEGAASADFYSAWAHFLPDEFPFEHRSRRPPHNPVNACLSFTSTILYQEMVAACFAAGLDPGLGSLHHTENGRWSLALDLLEPFRPVIIEALTLDLFSRRMLDASHFEPKKNGIYLNWEGRQKLILQYEKRMERYFHSEHIAQRSTLRLLLRQLPLLYKRHITDQSPFAPFRMN